MKKAISRKNIWELTPSPLKRMIGGILSPIPTAWLLGRAFRSQRSFANGAQSWSAERSRQYQLERLREILSLAYTTTRFYRSRFDASGFRPDDLKNLEDMNQLPTTDRHAVSGNLSDMCTKSTRDLDVDFGSTGGLSGKPLHFYLNASRSHIEYAYLVSSWQRVGYELGMPMAVLRGRVIRPDRNGFRHQYDPLLRHHYYSSFHLSEEDMHRYLEHIGGDR